MTANAYLLWFALIAAAGCILGCRTAVHRSARAARHLAERYRHRRELRRWHQTCAIHDHQLLDEADAIVRQAERRRT